MSETQASTNLQNDLDAGQANIVFATDIIPDKQSFTIMKPFKCSGLLSMQVRVNSPAFIDLLVITGIPEGCPGFR